MNYELNTTLPNILISKSKPPDKLCTRLNKHLIEM